MMNEHTTKAFDVDLQEIARLVAEMGGLAEKQIADSVDALEVVGDAQRAHDLAQIDRHGLATRDGEHGLLLDFALQRIDRRIDRNHPPAAFGVAVYVFSLRAAAATLGPRRERLLAVVEGRD